MELVVFCLCTVDADVGWCCVRYVIILQQTTGAEILIYLFKVIFLLLVAFMFSFERPLIGATSSSSYSA
jgi:hypothetical protein